jgi:VanZ family protein
MINTFINMNNLSRIEILKFVLILGIFIAVLNEIYQYFIPLRGFQIQDIVMNSSGVICASCLRLFRMRQL